jgi:hypothetical protein
VPCCAPSALLPQLTRDDYLAHWATFAPKIRDLANNVTNGRGFQIIR